MKKSQIQGKYTPVRLTRLEIRKIILLAVFVIFGALFCGFLAMPVRAVETTFFGEVQDDGSGCGVYMILNSVIDIMTYGVGALAIIGTVIAGIIYLTAGDNEARATKAKTRLFEIVIGLAIYATIWGILNFLLPGGDFNTSIECPVAAPGSSSGPSDTSGTTGGTSTKPAKSSSTGTTKTETKGEKVLRAAESLAGVLEKNKIKYYNNGRSTKSSIIKNKETNCAGYASAALTEAGFGKSSGGMSFWFDHGTIKGSDADYVKKHFKVIYPGGKSLSSLVKDGTIQPGDLIGSTKYLHTEIYAGKKNGKYIVYSAGRGSTDTGETGGTFVKSKILNTKRSGDTPIGVIVRVK